MRNIELPFNKVVNPVDYKTIEKLRSFDSFSCTVSNSQLMKRLDHEEALNIIDSLENGESV